MQCYRPGAYMKAATYFLQKGNLERQTAPASVEQATAASPHNQAQLPTTLPKSISANMENPVGLKSRSVAKQPTQRSTTVTSMLSFASTRGSKRTMRIFLPQSGFALGLLPVWAASKTKC